jgi:hypothetical protein
MRTRILIVSGVSAIYFLLTLVTGPPSFDATDGAEFAVCGSELQIAHAPGYPLFLMIVRVFSTVLSPLYGHLRMLNSFLGAVATALGYIAFRKLNIRFLPALAGTVLFLTSAPVLSQFNSLEVYPLAIVLVMSAICLKGTALASYASGMALFGGHPVSLLSAPLFVSLRKRGALLPALLIPATLFLYIPLRSGACRTAHYGHPGTINTLFSYFTMYSGRFHVPSAERLWHSLESIGIPGLLVFAFLAAAGGRFKLNRDISIVAAVLFLSSYQLPDPAGQLWILLLPLSVRSAFGIQFLLSRNTAVRIATAVSVLIAVAAGIPGADRTADDIALRWTTDVMSALPAGSVYRPVAHDTFYAAYAQRILGFREDILLSDPYGDFFEFSPPGSIPPVIGDRTVHISRAWDRTQDYALQGLIFSPTGLMPGPPNFNGMAVFRFHGRSPDPMAMDIVAEAWMRRMIQESNPVLADSFYRIALEFSATKLTRRRIETIREVY